MWDIREGRSIILLYPQESDSINGVYLQGQRSEAALIGRGGGQGTLDRDSSACEHINFVTRTEVQHFLSIIKRLQPFPNPFSLQCRSVGWLVSNSTCLFPVEKLACFYLKPLERNLTYESLYPSTNFKNVETGKEQRKFYLTLNTFRTCQFQLFPSSLYHINILDLYPRHQTIQNLNDTEPWLHCYSFSMNFSSHPTSEGRLWHMTSSYTTLLLSAA